MKQKIKSIINKLPYIRKLNQQVKNFNDNSCYSAGHFYSPIISVTDIKERENEIWKDMETDGIKDINLNTEDQIKFLKDISSYYNEMPFKPQKQDGMRYYFENPFYSYTDGIVLYSIIRHLKPKRIIEIGSGFSSAVMLDVNELFFQNKIELTFIEPYPERLYSLMSEKDRATSKVIENIVQKIEPQHFSQLEKGDILFIDSSHVVKCGSDVQYIFFKILPYLQKGVIIHFHDVFYPFEYPKNWVLGGFNWNEDYFLRAFLMYNERFKIKLFSHYIHLHHSKAFAGMPLSYENGGGNLWLEKV